MATILLVEQHSNLARLHRYFLEDSGHNVVQAANGSEGIALYNPDIELVICDVDMSDCGDDEMIAPLLELNPQVKLIGLYMASIDLLALPRNVMFITLINKQIPKPEFRAVVEHFLR